MKRHLFIVAINITIMLFVLVGRAMSQIDPCLQSPTGLVSWWPADNNANDIVDGNHGVLMNGAAFGAGLSGQAFYLDGIDDFIMVPHSPSLNFGTNDFTVAMWVNFMSTAGEQILIEKYVETGMDIGWSDRPRVGWTLSKRGDAIWLAGPVANYGGMMLNATPPSIPTNTWIFVVLTRQSDYFTLYWNGLLLNFAYFSVNLDSEVSLKIGHRGNPTDTPGSLDTRGFYLNGFVDDVQIFNHALSASEIASIYNCKISTECPEANQLNQCLQENKTLKNGINTGLGNLEQNFQQIFNDPQFVISGTTGLDKFNSLINGILNMNKGSKQNLYKNLSQ